MAHHSILSHSISATTFIHSSGKEAKTSIPWESCVRKDLWSTAKLHWNLKSHIFFACQRWLYSGSEIDGVRSKKDRKRFRRDGKRCLSINHRFVDANILLIGVQGDDWLLLLEFPGQPKKIQERNLESEIWLSFEQDQLLFTRGIRYNICLLGANRHGDDRGIPVSSDSCPRPRCELDHAWLHRGASVFAFTMQHHGWVYEGDGE